MSTASAARRRELWPWFGHNGWRFAIGLSAVAAIPYQYRPAWVSLPVVFLMVMAFFAMQDHDRNLCERCIAKWPLDPQQEIVKHDRALRGVHFLDNHRPRWGGKYSISILFVLLYLAIDIPIEKFAPIWVYNVWMGAFSLIVTPWIFWTAYQHKRLDAWCPYCRRGGRGKDTFDPNPTPQREKELT